KRSGREAERLGRGVWVPDGPSVVRHRLLPEVPPGAAVRDVAEFASVPGPGGAPDIGAPVCERYGLSSGGRNCPESSHLSCSAGALDIRESTTVRGHAQVPADIPLVLGQTDAGRLQG